MKFLLVAYMLVNGDVHSYVVDYDLSFDDCRVAVTRPIEDAAMACEPMTKNPTFPPIISGR